MCAEGAGTESALYICSQCMLYNVTSEYKSNACTHASSCTRVHQYIKRKGQNQEISGKCELKVEDSRDMESEER